MPRFDPLNPFPLLSGNISYAEEKLHSLEADVWLGLRIEETEGLLSKSEGQENWAQKGAAVFLTPYTELRKIMEELALQAGDTVVDLGAGYARLAFVLDRHFPGVKFLGYELVKERVSEGQRVLRERKCRNAELLCADLSQTVPAAATFYFLYDYGTRSAIEKTLGDLRGIASERPIILVGRGRAVRDALERNHPWLGEVVPPLHRAHYSIYRSS